jgi:hypothetical protein
MLRSEQPCAPAENTLEAVIMEALSRKLKVTGHSVIDVDEKTSLRDLGLLDSQDLVDIILEADPEW